MAKTKHSCIMASHSLHQSYWKDCAASTQNRWKNIQRHLWSQFRQSLPAGALAAHTFDNVFRLPTSLRTYLGMVSCCGHTETVPIRRCVGARSRVYLEQWLSLKLEDKAIVRVAIVIHRVNEKEKENHKETQNVLCSWNKEPCLLYDSRTNESNVDSPVFSNKDWVLI